MCDEVEKRRLEIEQTDLTDSEKEEALHEWKIRKWRKEKHKNDWKDIERTTAEDK